MIPFLGFSFVYYCLTARFCIQYTDRIELLIKGW